LLELLVYLTRETLQIIFLILTAWDSKDQKTKEREGEIIFLIVEEYKITSKWQ